MFLSVFIPTRHRFHSSIKSIVRLLLITLVLALAGCNATVAPKEQQTNLPEPTEVNRDTNAESIDKKSLIDNPKNDQNNTSIDLWARIHQNYTLSEGNITQQGKRRIQSYLTRYSRHPESLFKQTERASLYLHYVVEVLEKNNMPSELALLPFVESSYDPFAYSSGRASGLWQFIPGTGRRFKLKENWWLDERRDIVASTQAAVRYFKYLHNFFDGDWLLALAAYNAGEGTVRRAIKKNRRKGLRTDYWSLPLPRETKNYVPKLLAWTKIIQEPSQYGLTLAAIENQPYFTVIDVGSQIDLATFAEISHIDINTVYALNPAYNRWATDPEAPHNLIIPVGKSESATQALAAYPLDQHIRWQRYTIKPNDSLSVIARKYGTTVATLQSVNKLKTSRIRVGRSLLIPQASKELGYYSHSASQRLKKRQDNSGKTSQHRIMHTVTSGETLWSISRSYKVSPNRLAHWNNMAPKDVLNINQELIVWKNAPAASTSPPQSRADRVVRRVSYRVRSGDSLSVIAQKFNVSIRDIRKWNRIDSNKLIHPGQRLKLLVSVADQARRF